MKKDAIFQAIVAAAEDLFERPITEQDDFFSLGGDSLNAVELAARLEDLLGIELDLHTLWDAETFLGFAAELAEECGAGLVLDRESSR
ncbi:phosphopantetheine-binding protein [Streptosporangium sp. NPDC003464]